MASSTSGWKTLFKIFLAGRIFASCCFFFGLGKLAPRDSEQQPRPSPIPGLADLGTVLIPDSTPLQEARASTWRVIVGFVQHIRYELPTDAFGLIPPALIPAQDRGDCDSKALLAVMLLRQAGIDAVMLYSDPLAHAAVGIGLPGSGTSLRLGGRTYRYAEVTSVGWPIGMIPPRYDQPRQWKVLPLSDLDGAG